MSAGFRGKAMELSHVEGDLFSAGPSVSLAHCISADCRMGKGIAVQFRNKFGGVGDLKAQVASGLGVGSALVLKRGRRHVFYLVTKSRSYEKPTYAHLKDSLNHLRDQCSSLGVEELAMPRIGCGLDRLHWDKVAKMIEEVFADAGIDITIYYK